VLWPLGTGVGLGPGNIVLDGDPDPAAPKKTGAQHSPILGHVYSGQRVGWIKMILGTEVGLGPGHIMLDGDPAPLPKEGTAPKCLAHACCGQTTEWIKMPLGIEVGLGPGDAVLDGDPAPSPKRAQSRNFRPISVVAKTAG